nr:MAG TPA: hypothetical protein [Caudoviricetes sp.]
MCSSERRCLFFWLKLDLSPTRRLHFLLLPPHRHAAVVIECQLKLVGFGDNTQNLFPLPIPVRVQAMNRHPALRLSHWVIDH